MGKIVIQIPTFLPSLNFFDGVPRLYQRAVKHQWKRYCCWPTGTDFEIGDYGVLKGGIFVPEGNIEKDYDIKCPKTTDTKPTRIDRFSSSRKYKIDFEFNSTKTVKGIRPIEGMTISFQGAGIVFIDAQESFYDRLQKLPELNRNISKNPQADKDLKGKLIVMHILRATNVVIIISEASGGTVKFKASIPINLPNSLVFPSNPQLSFSSSENIAFKTISAEMPLMMMLGKYIQK